MNFESPIIEDKQSLVNQVVRLCLPFLYKKIKTKVKIFCPNCGTYKTISSETFKQVKYSRICPNCFTNFNRLVDADRNTYSNHLVEYIAIDKVDGVQVRVNYQFNKKPKLNEIKHVFHTENGKDYIKDIYMVGMGYPMHIKPIECKYDYIPNHEWKRTKGSYRYYFWSNYNTVIKTKKEYLENEASFIGKSNQKKLCIDNLFNEQQIVAIKMFDLKRADEVYKYRTWINSNIDARNVGTETYNYYLLKYLYKNKISLNLYKDYESMCKKLNRKIDKPKDFKLWHDRLQMMIEIQKNPKYVTKIEKRYKKLSKNNYQKKNIEIKAFETYEEIINISHMLHNCMSRLYVEPYCKGKSDLYHLDVDGIPTLAIEVCDKKLKQCYGNHNSEPPKELKKIVKKWILSYE